MNRAVFLDRDGTLIVLAILCKPAKPLLPAFLIALVGAAVVLLFLACSRFTAVQAGQVISVPAYLLGIYVLLSAWAINASKHRPR